MKVRSRISLFLNSPHLDTQRFAPSYYMEGAMAYFATIIIVMLGNVENENLALFSDATSVFTSPQLGLSLPRLMGQCCLFTEFYP